MDLILDENTNGLLILDLCQLVYHSQKETLNLKVFCLNKFDREVGCLA